MDEAPNELVFTEDDLSEYDRRLIELYESVGRTVDELAYTPDFDAIYTKLQAMGDKRSQAEVFRRLLNLRKSGRLPKVA